MFSLFLSLTFFNIYIIPYVLIDYIDYFTIYYLIPFINFIHNCKENNRYLIKPDWAFYYNSYEWNYILDKNGFVVIESNSLFTELSNDIRYDNLFYSFYKKK